MSFIARDHEASVVIFVRYVHVSTMLQEVLDNVQPSIKACSPQGGGVSGCGVVHICTILDQHLRDSYYYIISPEMQSIHDPRFRFESRLLKLKHSHRRTKVIQGKRFSTIYTHIYWETKSGFYIGHCKRVCIINEHPDGSVFHI